jgi:hypothetical protein
MNNMKYLFHALVIVLFPASFYRFFFKFGAYPWNDFFVCLYIGVATLFVYMADLSFRFAKETNNPGYVEWEHFRT